MREVIIVGSSRNDGDAIHLAEQLLEQLECNQLDLNDYQFSYFDYAHSNQNDDYINLMKEIIQKYDTLIFVTPVYLVFNEWNYESIF